VIADLPAPPPPPLHPATLEPVGPDDLASLFPTDLILQEVTADRHVDIPAEVLDVYRLWRPTPLHRARRLERALGTPAHIYYKYEGVSPAGSHKPNTAALAATIDEARRCAETGEEKVILTALCGHGHFDMSAYARHLSGEMTDFALPQDRIEASLTGLPSM
jgi:predicted alternative tryptophan synthase beta-subunit